MLNMKSGNNIQVEGRKTFPRHHHLYTIDKSNVAYWEYLDPAASEESILATGRAVGYGSGIKEGLEEFDKARRSQASEKTGATLPFADGDSSSSAFSAPKPRLSRGQKEEEKGAASAKTEEAKVRRDEREVAVRAARDSQNRKDIDVCSLCHTRFLTAGGFGRHREKGCGKRKLQIERERTRARRSVVCRLLAMGDLAMSESNDRIRNLALVTVELTAPADKAVPNGIEV